MFGRWNYPGHRYGHGYGGGWMLPFAAGALTSAFLTPSYRPAPYYYPYQPYYPYYPYY